MENKLNKQILAIENETTIDTFFARRLGAFFRELLRGEGENDELKKIVSRVEDLEGKEDKVGVTKEEVQDLIKDAFGNRHHWTSESLIDIRLPDDQVRLAFQHSRMEEGDIDVFVEEYNRAFDSEYDPFPLATAFNLGLPIDSERSGLILNIAADMMGLFERGGLQGLSIFVQAYYVIIADLINRIKRLEDK